MRYYGSDNRIAREINNGINFVELCTATSRADYADYAIFPVIRLDSCVNCRTKLSIARFGKK